MVSLLAFVSPVARPWPLRPPACTVRTPAVHGVPYTLDYVYGLPRLRSFGRVPIILRHRLPVGPGGSRWPVPDHSAEDGNSAVLLQDRVAAGSGRRRPDAFSPFRGRRPVGPACFTGAQICNSADLLTGTSPACPVIVVSSLASSSVPLG